MPAASRAAFGGLFKLACAAVALVMAIPPSAAGAHADPMTNWYTRKDNPDCTQGPDNWVDPITFGAIGTWANYESVSRYFNDYSGWDYTDGPHQRVPSHYICYQDGRQNANGGNLDSRYHIRLFWAHHQDFKRGGQTHREHYTWGSPHWEDFYGVCHRVPDDGFVRGKRRAKDIMEGIGFPAVEVWVGNTEPRRQCAVFNASNYNGTAFVMYMGQYQ